MNQEIFKHHAAQRTRQLRWEAEIPPAELERCWESLSRLAKPSLEGNHVNPKPLAKGGEA
ncbi:MAG: hypothetical protein C4331_16885 [Meiothermus sp.]